MCTILVNFFFLELLRLSTISFLGRTCCKLRFTIIFQSAEGSFLEHVSSRVYLKDDLIVCVPMFALVHNNGICTIWFERLQFYNASSKIQKCPVHFRISTVWEKAKWGTGRRNLSSHPISLRRNRMRRAMGEARKHPSKKVLKTELPQSSVHIALADLGKGGGFN